MNHYHKNELIKQLKLHEGLELFPYPCTSKKMTIGVGRNIEDNGISENEAEFLLDNDINRCIEECTAVFFFFKTLTQIRQRVLIDMCFNLGISRLMKFPKMISALERSDWLEAAKEMLDSDWSKQVGKRSLRLAHYMEFDNTNFEGDL